MTIKQREQYEALLASLTSLTASDCVPCAQSTMAVEMPAQAEAALPSVAHWAGILGFEGEMTGDGRFIEPNALRWENLPLPIRYVSSDVGAHDGAQVVGLITHVERREGGVIWAEGTLDLDSDVGREAFRQVDQKLTTGVSLDLDDVSFEVRLAAEIVDKLIAEASAAAAEPADPVTLESNDDGTVTVAKMSSSDEIRCTVDGRIRAATIVAIPAFANARISIVGTDNAPLADPPMEWADEALVASAIPDVPPAAWFNNPNLTEPTPLKVTAEGRVYGHLATWGTCHVGHAHKGCVTPPHSATNYAHFRTGSVLTAEGAEVPVGHITLETRHAVDRMTAAQALAHYEDTGRVAADVTVGEDSIGIWVAGALRSTLSDAQVRALRAAPLSGDWRRVGGNLELVAALAVNVPGFPIPRPSGLVASGVMHSLVASGMLAPERVLPPTHPEALSVEDLRWLKRLAAREKAEASRAELGDLSAAEELARRVRVSELAMKRRTFSLTAGYNPSQPRDERGRWEDGPGGGSGGGAGSGGERSRQTPSDMGGYDVAAPGYVWTRATDLKEGDVVHEATVKNKRDEWEPDPKGEAATVTGKGDYDTGIGAYVVPTDKGDYELDPDLPILVDDDK